MICFDMHKSQELLFFSVCSKKTRQDIKPNWKKLVFSCVNCIHVSLAGFLLFTSSVIHRKPHYEFNKLFGGVDSSPRGYLQPIITIVDFSHEYTHTYKEPRECGIFFLIMHVLCVDPGLHRTLGTCL